MKTRLLTAERPELREQEGAPPALEGYASVFNSEAVIGGRFREMIAPGAFARALKEGDDVVALFNHNPDSVIGRTSNGTLRLSEDAHGLKYVVDLNPDDPDAQRVLAKVRRGDVVASSFAFSVVKEDVQRKAGDELPLRVIQDVKLYDVSPVTTPAYAATSVSARDADADAKVVEAIEREEQATREAWRATHQAKLALLGKLGR